MTPTLHNAHWWADLRDEAAEIDPQRVDLQTDAIHQAISDLQDAGRITRADATMTRWELGLESEAPAVGYSTGRFIAAHLEARGVDPFLTYAQGLEQAIARDRSDWARAQNPTPRKAYPDGPAPAPTRREPRPPSPSSASPSWTDATTPRPSPGGNAGLLTLATLGGLAVLLTRRIRR